MGVDVASATGRQRRTPDQLGFRYRRSNLVKGEVVARARFKLEPADGRDIRAKLDELRVGDAGFSAKHSNFVENFGSAATADVVARMAAARERVKQRLGIELEPEVRTLGPVEFPSDWRRS